MVIPAIITTIAAPLTSKLVYLSIAIDNFFLPLSSLSSSIFSSIQRLIYSVATVVFLPLAPAEATKTTISSSPLFSQ